MDGLIEEVVDQTLTKVGDMCKDDRRMDAIYASIIQPLIKYMSQRMAWFVTAVQSLGCLVVVQTILLVVVLREIVVRQPP
jgi:hypothetical protein